MPNDVDNWDMSTEGGMLIFRNPKTGKRWTPPPPTEEAPLVPLVPETPKPVLETPKHEPARKIRTESFWLASNNIHAIAGSLELFFKDLFQMKPSAWAGMLKERLMFSLLSRPLMVQAFLYGEPNAVTSEGNEKAKKIQDWLRWVVPLFSTPVDDADEIVWKPEVGLAAHRSNGGYNEAPSRALITQATLLTVTLLHSLFRDGHTEPFAQQLTQFMTRMQGVGWNEASTMHVRDVFRAFLSKISNGDALSLKQNFEHGSWDNVVVLANAIEEFCFFSAFSVQPEPGTVGLHLELSGCADKELLAECDKLLNGKLSVSSLPNEVVRDFKKRKDQLTVTASFFACATKWAESFASVVEEAIKTPLEVLAKQSPRKAYHTINIDGSGRGPKYPTTELKEHVRYGIVPAYDAVTSELVEHLSKHRNFRKKQAGYMLYQAIEICRQRQVIASQKTIVTSSPKETDESSWDDIAPEIVLEQTKASAYNLRRMIRFLTAAVKAQEEFVNVSERVMQKEVKKAYFCPGYEHPLPRHEDKLPAVLEASAVMLSLMNGFTYRVKSFVEEMQTEVIAPLLTLKAAYNDAANLFHQQYLGVEKMIETERQTILKEYEVVEKELADLQLASAEYEEGKRTSSAAEKKAAQKKVLVAQRVAIRVSKYEKLCANFESQFRPATLRLLRAHTASLYQMERRRIRSVKSYVSRFLNAFARLNGAYSPVFELSTTTLANLDESKVMHEFMASVKQQTPPPPLPEPMLSSVAILENTPVSSAPILVTCEHCGALVSQEDMAEGGCSCGQLSKGAAEDKASQLAVQFEEYMEEQGYPDSVREKMRTLFPAQKLALLRAATKGAEGKQQKQDLPTHWSKTLHTSNKLTVAQLTNFKFFLTSKATKKWLQDFAAAGGMDSLYGLLTSRADSAGMPLKHEALLCLAAIMKNKAGLEVVAKTAPLCLVSIAGSPDYSAADKLVIVELLAIVAVSDEGRKSVVHAFERGLDVLVRFCSSPGQCPKCALQIFPYVPACIGCEFEFALDMPLASITLINHMLHSITDRETASEYRAMLEGLGLLQVLQDMREYCSTSASLMTPCSPQYLDCTTKGAFLISPSNPHIQGPRRCICEADTGSTFGRSLSMPQPAVQAGTGGGLVYGGKFLLTK